MQRVREGGRIMRVGRAVGRAATGMTCAHQALHVGIAQAPHLNDRRRAVALRHAHQPLSCMPRCLLAGSCQAALAQLCGGRLCRQAWAPSSQVVGNTQQRQVAAGGSRQRRRRRRRRAAAADAPAALPKLLLQMRCIVGSRSYRCPSRRTRGTSSRRRWGCRSAPAAL